MKQKIVKKDNRQINKLIKHLDPGSTFSRRERKYFRQAMREEISEYLEEHPDTTYEDLQQHFADQETPADMQKTSHLRRTIIMICITLLLAIICAILITTSNTWETPTYRF